MGLVVLAAGLIGLRGLRLGDREAHLVAVRRRRIGAPIAVLAEQRGLRLAAAGGGGGRRDGRGGRRRLGGGLGRGGGGRGRLRGRSRGKRDRNQQAHEAQS